MIIRFRDKGMEDIFNGINSKDSRSKLPHPVWKTASRKLDLLDSVLVLTDLPVPPGNHLESLIGERTGQHSIRINDQYRICFIWTVDGPDLVEIVDYH